MAPQSTSILLQGQRQPTKPTLFLLPGGAGSANPYTCLPPFTTGHAVIGLNSPFLTCPGEHPTSLPTVAELFLPEILRHQPAGPFLLGGHSMGGAYAYEVACALAATGHKIAGLILIDAPYPPTMPAISLETVELLGCIGVFDGVKKDDAAFRLPDKVSQHVSASIEALKQYTPTRLEGSEAVLKGVVIWGSQGVWEGIGEEERIRCRENLQEAKGELEGKDWMMDKRDGDFGKGWETLIQDLKYEVIDGDHFSIMRPPRVCIKISWYQLIPFMPSFSLIIK